jgi:hypothetical protein
VSIGPDFVPLIYIIRNPKTIKSDVKFVSAESGRFTFVGTGCSLLEMLNYPPH